MALTVKQLIAKLRNMPSDALVAWQNHDQSVDEIDGYAGQVTMGEAALLQARAAELDWHRAKAVVVLSP